MFVIYNRHTKCIYDSSNAVLLYIKVAFEPPDRYEFSLFNLKFKLSLREVCKRADTVRCVQTVSGKYIVKKKCNDCGEDAVNWLRACVSSSNDKCCATSHLSSVGKNLTCEPTDLQVSEGYRRAIGVRRPGGQGKSAELSSLVVPHDETWRFREKGIDS